MADSQVSAWLRHAGLSRFNPRFAAALVSAPIFLQLSPADLDALGVDGPADRKRLSDLIAELRRASPNGTKHSSPPRANTTIGVRRMSKPSVEQVDRGEERQNRRLSRANSLTNPGIARTASSPPRMARVSVCVRKRPLSRKEIIAGDKDVITVESEVAALCVHELKEKVDLTKYVETHPFSFDRVFGEHASNAAVYEGTARPLVDALFSGGRATCFAYGQTGAGKTFTMAGDGVENPGLFGLAVRDVFDRIRREESELWRKAEAEGNDDFEPPDPAQVWISFYEIYASKLHDLLNRSAKLECREDSNNEVQIVGLAHRLCEVEEDVLACIEEGSRARSTGVTGANDDSSRSHAVFQIELRHPPGSDVEQDASTALKQSLLRNTRSRTAAALTEAKRGEEIGRLCFIDLAGSERGSDTASSTRQTRMEGAEINKSLLALKECIRAMDQKKDHTPFRGSKLTQVLKASFMGKNCRTVMIANISPAASNVEHTLNTLRYSDRVKEIKKDRVPTVGQGNELGRLGGRRATFSHGIGLRAGRNALMQTPLRTTQRQVSPESGFVDDVGVALEPSGNERKASKSQIPSRPPDRLLDKDEAPSALPRAASRPSSRKSVLRSRGRDGRPSLPSIDFPAANETEQNVSKKARESKLARRRTTRAPSVASSRPSSRPSSGSSLLPRAEVSIAGSGREVGKLSRRSNSVAKLAEQDRTQLTTNENRSPSSDAESEATKIRRVERLGVDEVNVVGAVPDFRPVEGNDSRRVRQKTKRASSSLDTFISDGRKDSRATKLDQDLGTKPRSAAESAMKYYMTNKKDELQEEDLLFASTDHFTDAATVAAQARLVAASAEAEQRVLVPARRSNSCTPESDAVAPSNSSDIGTSPPTSDDSSPERSFTTESSASARSLSESLRKVIRFHHVQIEELMRLTESDVALVNAAEKGEMDVDEYALKLKLNLSQKLDIITTLRSKLELLE